MLSLLRINRTIQCAHLSPSNSSSRQLLRLSSLASTTFSNSTQLGVNSRSFHSTPNAFSPPREHFVVNAVGPDHPGIVNMFTDKILSLDGNISNTKAARLGGHFSLMMLCDTPTKINAKQVETELRNLPVLTTYALKIFNTEDPSSPVIDADSVSFACFFRVDGADHPAIIKHVTDIFIQHGLSVDRAETESEVAPHGGTTLFHMEGIATHAGPLSKDWDEGKIRDQLDELEAAENVDIEFVDLATLDDDDEIYERLGVGGDGDDNTDIEEIAGNRHA